MTAPADVQEFHGKLLGWLNEHASLIGYAERRPAKIRCDVCEAAR